MRAAFWSGAGRHAFSKSESGFLGVLGSHGCCEVLQIVKERGWSSNAELALRQACESLAS